MLPLGSCSHTHTFSLRGGEGCVWGERESERGTVVLILNEDTSSLWLTNSCLHTCQDAEVERLHAQIEEQDTLSSTAAAVALMMMGQMGKHYCKNI